MNYKNCSIYSKFLNNITVLQLQIITRKIFLITSKIIIIVIEVPTVLKKLIFVEIRKFDLEVVELVEATVIIEKAKLQISVH